MRGRECDSETACRERVTYHGSCVSLFVAFDAVAHISCDSRLRGTYCGSTRAYTAYMLTGWDIAIDN